MNTFEFVYIVSSVGSWRVAGYVLTGDKRVGGSKPGEEGTGVARVVVEILVGHWVRITSPFRS